MHSTRINCPRTILADSHPLAQDLVLETRFVPASFSDALLDSVVPAIEASPLAGQLRTLRRVRILDNWKPLPIHTPFRAANLLPQGIRCLPNGLANPGVA